jgi:hypothetical protein
MKLIRKQSAPIITDIYGIAHPELCIKHFSVPEDKKSGWLEVHCGYYHNDASTSPMMDFGANFSTFVIRFDKTQKDGWPQYPDVLNDIEITSDGDLIALNASVPNWLLTQTSILDCEGKPFSENWEII